MISVQISPIKFLAGISNDKSLSGSIAQWSAFQLLHHAALSAILGNPNSDVAEVNQLHYINGTAFKRSMMGVEPNWTRMTINLCNKIEVQ